MRSKTWKSQNQEKMARRPHNNGIPSQTLTSEIFQYRVDTSGKRFNSLSRAFNLPLAHLSITASQTNWLYLQWGTHEVDRDHGEFDHAG